MNNTISTKRFVIRQSLVGQGTIIKVEFKNGKSATYDHDKAFAIMKQTLEALPCWAKYKSYTASSNVPKAIRETEAMLEMANAPADA